MRNSAKAAVTPSPPGAGAANSEAQNVVLQYRFKSSLNIPSLSILEEGVRNDGQELIEGGTIELTDPDCGEVITSHNQTIYYSHGLASVNNNGDGTYQFCRADDRDIHYVATISGTVLVEIIGFAESGVTKDDVIKIASSLHPVH